MGHFGDLEYYMEEVNSGPLAMNFDKVTQILEPIENKQFVLRSRINTFWDSGPFAIDNAVNSNHESFSPIPDSKGASPLLSRNLERNYDNTQGNSNDFDQMVEGLPVGHNDEHSLYDGRNYVKDNGQGLSEVCEEFETLSMTLPEIE